MSVCVPMCEMFWLKSFCIMVLSRVSSTINKALHKPLSTNYLRDRSLEERCFELGVGGVGGGVIISTYNQESHFKEKVYFTCWETLCRVSKEKLFSH